jgi:outer membrane protein OmpA-like peptidoglycan-associated protein
MSMKSYWLTAFLGLALVVAGCGTTHSVKSSSTGHMKNSQMDDFLGLGEVVQTAGGFRLTVSADDLFGEGLTSLTDNGVRKVDVIATTILKYPKDFMAINVYTDSGADAGYAANLQLSQLRASAIKDELVKQGVSLSSVTVVGKGPAQPEALNDTDQDRAENRRIEFEVTTRQ